MADLYVPGNMTVQGLLSTSNFQGSMNYAFGSNILSGDFTFTTWTNGGQMTIAGGVGGSNLSTNWITTNGFSTSDNVIASNIISAGNGFYGDATYESNFQATAIVGQINGTNLSPIITNGVSGPISGPNNRINTISFASTSITIGGNNYTFFSTPGTAANATAFKNFHMLCINTPCTLSNFYATFVASTALPVSTNYYYQIYTSSIGGTFAADQQMLLCLQPNGTLTYVGTNDSTQFIHLTPPGPLLLTCMASNSSAGVATAGYPALDFGVYNY